MSASAKVKTRVTYVISEIDRALALEWVADMIDSRRFELSFILLKSGPSAMETFLRERAIAVRRITFDGARSQLPLAFLRVWWTLMRWRPDVVHCHLIDANRLGLIAGWLAGVRGRIYTRHYSSLHHVYHRKGVWIDRFVNRFATKIVSISKGVRRVLLDWEGVSPEKVVDIPHGFKWSEFRCLDSSQLERLRDRFELRGRYPVVGAVGRFVDWKGLQFVVRAFLDLLSDYPDAVLVLPADQGPFRSRIEDELARLAPGSYRLIPHQHSPGLLFGLFDFYVHVPINEHIEAFGQTYVEALAAGVPSIFTLSGIAHDLARHEENCLVVPYQDSESISLALRRLIQDKSLGRRLSEQGWEGVRHRFEASRMVRSLEQLYDGSLL